MSYLEKIYDHACYPLQVLKEGECRTSVLAGPTCDSIDIVAEGIELPELEPGDLAISQLDGTTIEGQQIRVQEVRPRQR